MPRPSLPLTLSAIALSLVPTSQALADVPIRVPERFLGGAIFRPLAPGSGVLPGAPAGGPVAPDDTCRPREVDCVLFDDEDALETLPLGDLADPERGLTLDLPVPVEEIPADIDGEDVVEGEEDLSPIEGVASESARRRPVRAPVAPPVPDADAARAHGALLAPGPSAWLAWQRPTLRWRPRTGADLYNVQVFRGGRRVLVAWTTRTRLTMPEGALRQGRTYVWVVWPARGTRSAARYGRPLGRSNFALTLRPRIVFRRAGDGRTVGEVRPRIPHAVLALTAPRGLRARVPGHVRLDRRSHFTLAIPRRPARRLRASLRDRGPRPPVGLRGGLLVPTRQGVAIPAPLGRAVEVRHAGSGGGLQPGKDRT